MSSNNDGRRANTSYALTISEKNALKETRSYTQKCGSKIADAEENFSQKGQWGLWWDAKGLFNCSDAKEVTAHMEKYKHIYEEIDALSAQVEKGDPKSYDRLLDLYKMIAEKERDAKRDVENNRSKATCQMLREFLNEKFKRDHNMTKVECIVWRQRNHAVEQTCKSAIDSANEMSKKMDKLIEENREVRRENAEKLKKVLEEAEERSEARIREMKEESDKSRLEAENRSEAIRRESDEKLGKLIEENRGIRELIETMRKEKEELASEAEKRSEAIRRESDEKLKLVLKEAEERSEARIRKMKEESDKLRLEAEMIRQESDEKLKQAVEEAERRSEARMQEMAEQNRLMLQNMRKMLEAMNLS